MPHDLPMPAGLTERLAGWAAGLTAEDVPEPVRRQLRLLLLDCLGAGLYGRALPWSQAVTTWAERQPAAAGPGLASRWGRPQATLRATDAALANGTAAHAFELDDFHNAKLHPGAVVMPAVLALAEARGIAGDRVLTAIAAGYEIMIRLALALGPSPARLRGWHLTGVCGSIGAAVGCAHLLGLDATRTAWAMGLGGTQSAGVFAFNADGSMSKRLHAGRSAQSGVLAAELAELGFSGPTQLLETADGGWLKTFCAEATATPLLDDLGSRWQAAETSFKPYACCGSLHAYIDAALDLRDAWKAGARVRAGLPKVVEVQCGFPYEEGSVLNAQMSAQYCVAVALADGAVLPAQFEVERIADPALTALAKQVELLPDPALDKLYPARFAGWVEIEEAPGSGRFRRVSHDDPSGNPANPRWEETLRSKFHRLVEPLGAAGAAEALEAGVLSLETLPAGALAGLLTAFPD